jgi:UDP-GlcNAc:undecaprenyl-phosphate/decaprenyl-phosphate GlcNAc-1-phosphate transferase
MITLLAWGLVAFGLSGVLTAAVRRIALRSGAVVAPTDDRWHKRPVPTLGGVAMAVTVLALAPLSGISDPEVWILLAAASIFFIVGLIDDLRPLNPQTKFVVQILVASGLAALGLQLRLTGLPWLDVLVTLFWVVGITNAFNLLDNMDGLAAGIAAIAVGFRLVFLQMDGNTEAATVSAIFVGTMLGFLIFNFNPASIFMGDAGSLFIGLMVSGLNLVGQWPYSRGTFSVLLFPVIILLVPIFDTALVTLARVLAGRPISQGGRDHTSHRLVALGLTERRAVVLLYIVAFAAGVVAFIGYRAALPLAMVLAVLLALGLGFFGVYLGRLRLYPESEVTISEGTRFVSFLANFSYKRQVATVFIDFVLIVLAYHSAYLLRFEDTYALQQPAFVKSLPVVIVCQMMAFAAFQLYQGVWRYTSLRDLLRLVQAATVGCVASALAVLFIWRFEGFSRTVFVLDWILLVSLVSACRLSFRALGEVLRPEQTGSRRVLIYGAGDGGVMVLREVINNAALDRQVVAFLDDDRSKHSTKIHGISVVGGLERLTDVARALDVSEVIVATSKIPHPRLSELSAVCEEHGIALSRASLRFE